MRADPQQLSFTDIERTSALDQNERDFREFVKRHRKRRRFGVVLELAGTAAVVGAAFMWNLTLGVFTLGLAIYNQAFE
jgi:hypothetical protein